MPFLKMEVNISLKSTFHITIISNSNILEAAFVFLRKKDIFFVFLRKNIISIYLVPDLT